MCYFILNLVYQMFPAPLISQENCSNNNNKPPLLNINDSSRSSEKEMEASINARNMEFRHLLAFQCPQALRIHSDGDVLSNLPQMMELRHVSYPPRPRPTAQGSKYSSFFYLILYLIFTHWSFSQVFISISCSKT